MVWVAQRPRAENWEGMSRGEKGLITLEGDNSTSLLSQAIQDSPVDTSQPPTSQSPGDRPRNPKREVVTGDSYHQEKVGILRFRC